MCPSRTERPVYWGADGASAQGPTLARPFRGLGRARPHVLMACGFVNIVRFAFFFFFYLEVQST